MPYWDVQHNKQIQNNVSKEESQNSIEMQMKNGFENIGGKETPDSVKNLPAGVSISFIYA